ncbi:NfeD family protein [Roseisalinus antarcticus]|uniref:NfeD-like C-terminal domain-containing protein n=1 Tax=Roseisalinus antarcticus TaxID=254357 RepID=A0A1Y5TAX0_9RHOB|nr:hypothetical protein [Roseisalinus antarcticus]SLN57865.1 hypothetical protein ROA7023_02617 [Roseisalinus antarcticus]
MIGSFIIWNQWWAWICFGLLLGVFEMLLPAYVFLGFSGGAVVTGVLIWAEILGGSLPWKLVAFAAISGVAAIGLRMTLGSPTRRAKIWHSDIND